MSIYKTMNTGRSGMNANSRSMSAIGDNIANVNTVGYKRTRANFQDVLGNTTLGVGDGAIVGDMQQQFEQGSLEMTGRSMDMAISGNGFFVMKGNVNGEEGEFYSRAGQFTIDKDGYIGNGGGLRLQGYGVDADGNIDQTSVGDIQVGDLTAPPNATTTVTTGVNLDADEDVPAAAWDPNNPSDGSNYSTSVTIHDEQGREIQADVYYRKTGNNSWEYHVLVDGEDTAGGTAGTPVEITSGTLDYNADGSLNTHTPGAVNFTPAGSTNPQNITFDFEGSTQYADDSTLRSQTQDGYGAGELRDLRVEEDGTVTGLFSNGEEMVVGQVALARFEAPEGLERQGGNVWRATSASGEGLVGEAGSGGRGSIVAGALEGSNVDLAHEFVKMIAAQRGFQANSRTITTGDQMLQEAMNIKR
jgi:flagellar hook protein FlgE